MSQNSKPGADKALALTLPARVFTRSGTSLEPGLDVWRWTDGPFKRHIDFTHYSGGYERYVLPLKLTLIPFLKGSSSAHVVNLEAAYRYFVEVTGVCPAAGAFSAEHLSNFSAKLRADEQWRVGTLNGLIQKWVALALPGVLPECATYLAGRRKPGNKKGEAVATRDPVNGPLSESEYKTLHIAVNAAYGRGELPLWSLLLCRLLLACGGRISQYASLKMLDFDPETLVLRLPQAKTREEHARSQFLDSDISPQTGHLIADYFSFLRSEGYAEDAPFFPEEIVMIRPAKQLRVANDLFFGHSEPNTLSRRFRETVAEVAPPTPRLDFAPLPVAPQRFRYTYGTRLAEEGASKVVIANRLGHSDLQNVDVYFSASPKVVDNIDKTMGPLLIPLARAFQGHLVEDEASSTQKGAPGSRIIDFRVSTKPVGGCKQCAIGCAFDKPVACYTCFRFEPFLDAPHEKVLQRLLNDRERLAHDPRMEEINDESIRAVEEVIELCAQVRKQRQSDADAS